MIRVNDLTFSYRKNKQTLHGLTFTVSEGEILDFWVQTVPENPQHRKILTGVLKGYGGHVQVFGQELGHERKKFQEKRGCFSNFHICIQI